MIIYLDTETTGTDDEDRICQLAYKTDQGHQVNQLFRPPLPIKIGAMATHHITEKKVADKPPFAGSQVQMDLTKLTQDPDNFVVAHNAEYDIKMLAKEGVGIPRWYICTLKLFRSLDTEGEIESYQLQYLRYYYGIEVEAKAHDAFGDILILEKLFHLLWGKFQERFVNPSEIYNEMIRITLSPVLIPKIPFGKHKGLHFRNVPKDYLQWMLEQDFDSDMHYTAQYWLKH